MTPVQLDIFYNTTHLSKEDLLKRKSAARGQCLEILKFFRENPAANFTPFEVQEYAALNHLPITSIRRAINTLTTAGLIVKTNTMKPGEYGANNHTWKLL
jgi:hypothetical protein